MTIKSSLICLRQCHRTPNVRELPCSFSNEFVWEVFQSSAI